MNEEKKPDAPEAAEAEERQAATGAEEPQAQGEADPLTLALQAIDALRAENAELKDRVLRTLAEMDNLRKRAEREKAEATLYAASNFAQDLLSVADNFSRALSALSPEQRAKADELCSNLIAGVEVTERVLTNVFERHGIKRMEPLGQKFDPHMHQAMFEVPTGEQPPGTIVQVMQDGYVIGSRCLRPALVGVSKAPANDA